MKNSGFSSLVISNEDEIDLEKFFFSKSKHYLVFTNAGKPIYSMYVSTFVLIFISRHGDIYTLSPIIATLYAMLSKIQTYKFAP